MSETRMDPRVERIASLVRTIPDFPKPGVQFRDITPLLADPEGLADTIAELVDRAPQDIDVVAGIDSRGFIFGVPIAIAMGVGFVPVRKPGKLPAAVFEEPFDLEYGSSTLAMHQDALKPGQKVLLIDDLLATGGTLCAAARLIEREHAELACVQTVIELQGLGGHAALQASGITHFTSILSFQ